MPRPLLLPLLLLLPALVSCDPCDEEVLASRLQAAGAAPSPEEAAAVLADACDAPEALLAWLRQPGSPPPEAAGALWAEQVCPGGPTLEALAAQPRLAAHRAAHDGCALGALAERQRFVDGEGYPLLAAATAAWLRSEEVDPASIQAATEALLGQSRLPLPSEALPALSGDAIEPLPASLEPLVVVTMDRLAIGDQEVLRLEAGRLPPDAAPPRIPHPRFPDHVVSSIVEAAGDREGWLVAAEASVPAETLGRLLASLPGGEARLIGVQGEASPGTRRLVASQEADVVGTTVGELGAAADVGLGHRPCLSPPAGMACVPGGTATNGPHTAEVSTFYIETSPATAGQHRACEAAGICGKRSGKLGDGDAMVGLTWDAAHRYCIWAGGRLPSEAEWLRAVEAGAVTPAEGLRERTADWGSADLDACGEDCSGEDPQGVCDGAPECRLRERVLRGPGGRSLLRDGGQAGDVGLRCAVDGPHRTSFPARIVADPLPEPPPRQPLTPEQIALVRGIAEDPIWEKPECDAEPGHVTLSCRDSMTYVRSNEGRSWVWAPYVRNIGGAYIGVGSDQNYSFASYARSEIVWLMDYDPDVVGLHMVNRALTLAAETPQEFVRLYSYGAEKDALRIIEETYRDHPDLKYFLAHYRAFQPQVEWYYRQRSQPSGRDEETQWLRNPEQYAYVRLLWQQGRMWPVKGDLTGASAMQSMAEAARKLGVPVRIFYTSNAPDVWSGRLVPGYKRNVLALPMDALSVVLQSFKRPTGYGGPDGPWHFNVQAGREHQQLMAREGFTNVRDLVYRRIATDDIDLTLSGLPGGG